MGTTERRGNEQRSVSLPSLPVHDLVHSCDPLGSASLSALSCTSCVAASVGDGQRPLREMNLLFWLVRVDYRPVT